ncbi:hypothetical protein [Nocardia amamiensis]|uniref:hypothetical protein n=1 Tax=Nocardia TaxID=1817 RepID=UPI0033E895B3
MTDPVEPVTNVDEYQKVGLRTGLCWSAGSWAEVEPFARKAGEAFRAVREDFHRVAVVG